MHNINKLLFEQKAISIFEHTTKHSWLIKVL